jgi:hypothetical protein
MKTVISIFTVLLLSSASYSQTSNVETEATIGILLFNSEAGLVRGAILTLRDSAGADCGRPDLRDSLWIFPHLPFGSYEYTLTIQHPVFGQNVEKVRSHLYCDGRKSLGIPLPHSSCVFTYHLDHPDMHYCWMGAKRMVYSPQPQFIATALKKMGDLAKAHQLAEKLGLTWTSDRSIAIRTRGSDKANCPWNTGGTVSLTDYNESSGLPFVVFTDEKEGGQLQADSTVYSELRKSGLFEVVGVMVNPDCQNPNIIADKGSIVFHNYVDEESQNNFLLRFASSFEVVSRVEHQIVYVKLKPMSGADTVRLTDEFVKQPEVKQVSFFIGYTAPDN